MRSIDVWVCCTDLRRSLPKETSQNVGFHLLVAPPLVADSHASAPGSRPSTIQPDFSVNYAAAQRTPFFDLTRYNDFPQFEDYVRGVAQMNPEFVELRMIGWSREHRPLLGLKIGKRTNHTKPAVWFDGGNHAREWPAFHVIVYFIEQFVNQYKEDPLVTKYVDLLDIYVFPVLNPDGFIFSRTSKSAMIRQWRKNRAPTNCSGFTALQKNICCEGVDLNRNYDIAFSHRNYPFNNPCSDEFQGPYPFSEPETRAVRDFVTSKEIYGRLHALVSLHTHGQLWILPYNHHKKTYPEDFKELELLASKAADMVFSYRETKYRVGTAADLLGAATGGATDWIKKNTPTKYVYVLELPPDMSTWFAFQIKPHWLLPIGRETWLGIKVIMDQVIKETIVHTHRHPS